MKYNNISYVRLLIASSLLFLSCSSITAEKIKLSAVECAEVSKNPDAVYICLDSSMSDIKNVIIQLSKLDKDKKSPLHVFKRYMHQGFNIALYDEVIHVLEYAELIVQKKIIELGKTKMKRTVKQLKNTIRAVLDGLLHCDVHTLMPRLKDIEELVISDNNSDVAKRAVTVVKDDLEIQDNLIVKKKARVHGRLKVFQKASFRGNIRVRKDAEIIGNVDANSLSTADAIVDNLTVTNCVNDLCIKNLSVTDELVVNNIEFIGGSELTSLNVGTLSAVDAVIHDLEVINCISSLCVDNLQVLNCIPTLCVNNLSVIDGSVNGRLSINDAVIQSLTVSGGSINLTDLSLNTLTASDAVIDDLTVVNCMNSLCINNMSAGDITVASDITIDSFNTAGVVHNDASGNLSSSFIVNGDIVPGTITNDRLANVSSANVPNSLVLRDNFGNFITNMITLLGTVINPTDAATKAYVDSVIIGIEPKAPAVVVATTNKVLSGLQTIDGVLLAANDRVLLVSQSFPVQNGLWLAQAGAWTRPADFASGTTAGQAYVVITSGIVNSGSSWLCNTPNAVIDTNPISFVLFSLPQSTMGANVGAGTGLIFRNETGNTLNFKSLIAGPNVTISNNANDITLGISATNLNTANTVVKRDASGNFSAGTITATLNGNASSATNFSGVLAGDVTGTQGATVVSFVGGQSASTIASTATTVSAATSLNTPNTLVKRNGSGNFSAGTITATLNGNASSATNFSGVLAGDVTGTQGATVVSFVGGQSAANIATGTSLANAATSSNTANTIVKRNGSGNFSAGTITANLNGNATTATATTNFSGSLAGDVTGTQGATVVSLVGGQTAANVAMGTVLANASTSTNSANTIVRRNASGNFSAGTITATLNGNALSATNFSGSLAGDVTGTQLSTVVSFIAGQTAASVGAATVLANASTSSNTANTIVRRDASGNFSAGTITAALNGNATGFTGALAGDVTGTQGATVVSFVGGQSAANVATAASLASTATSANTPNTLVLRNGAGNFSAGTITATLNGNAATATTATTATDFSGSLAGDVTGTQLATVVSFVGGQSAANVATGTALANAATSSNTPNTIVERDGFGNFSAGTITATLSGTASNFSGLLSGDVTGTEFATVVSFVGGQSAANVATATVLANAATTANTPNTIVKRDASGNFFAGLITSSTGVVFPNGGSTLNYYFQTSSTPTFNSNTGTPATLSPTVLTTRIGNIVMVTVQAQSFTAASSPQFYTASAAVPVGLRPTQGQAQVAFAPLIGLGLYDATNMGTVIIKSSGDIVISRDANHIIAWSNATNQGWDSITVSYCV